MLYDNDFNFQQIIYSIKTSRILLNLLRNCR